jgi:hypothetical protein
MHVPCGELCPPTTPESLIFLCQFQAHGAGSLELVSNLHQVCPEPTNTLFMFFSFLLDPEELFTSGLIVHFLLCNLVLSRPKFTMEVNIPYMSVLASVCFCCALRRSFSLTNLVFLLSNLAMQFFKQRLSSESAGGGGPLLRLRKWLPLGEEVGFFRCEPSTVKLPTAASNTSMEYVEEA